MEEFLHSLPMKGPLKTVALDLLGAFPKSTQENRYIAVVTDFLN